MADLLEERFRNIGLADDKARETAANKKIAPILTEIINNSELSDNDIPKSMGALFYNLATVSNKKTAPNLPFLAREIALGHIKSNDQVQAAVKFFDKVTGTAFDVAAYESECGIGVEVSEEECCTNITTMLENHKQKVMTDRYRSLGFILGQVRNSRLRWANSAFVKEEVDRQLAALLGPKDDRDDPKLLKQKSKENNSTTKKESSVITNAVNQEEPKLDPEAMLRTMILEGEMSRLHAPGENPQTDPELMNKHLKTTGGKVMTRFPPEPNGFLHIGHAKAINIDFGYAKLHDGLCYLRYDDTNPDAEEKRYFDTILETVNWLGFTPWKITYSSDYFQQLYELAIKLITYDKAYVCHCSAEEMYEQRGGADKGPRTECVHRNRPIDESIRELEYMRQGRYAEGEAILRMKMDMTSGNPQFWDLAAYRIKYTPHYRTGSDWCIYPTYDYTHCLVDSLENITHSLCTLEFRQSRESYYWLIDALKLYKPVQWESGRLNINNTVMSKRKLNKLVEQGIVRGWDDPRLYTIVALRRRGIPASAINMFVRSTGVTTTNSLTDVSRLDWYVRSVLNDTAPRLFAVVNPIKVIISNLPANHMEYFEVPNNPRDPDAGCRKVPFTRQIYIELDDFRTEKSKDFFRLAPGQPVGLLQVPFPISYVSHKTNSDGIITEITVKYDNNNTQFKKPKTYIQWIAHAPTVGSPVSCEARIYGALFCHAFPDDVPDGWLSDIDPDSLQIKSALVDIGIYQHIRNAKAANSAAGIVYSSTKDKVSPHGEASDSELKSVEALKFQFIRVGYFCVDPDSDINGDDPTQWSLLFNKTIGLKEDGGKSKS